jgi:hypothetical protein
MKKFLITTGLATGIIAGGALSASAVTVDLTDINPPGAYTTQTGAVASGTAGGVTWTITPSAGTLTYNGGSDAPGMGDGLSGEGDGIGISGLGDRDEVDNLLDDRPREFLNLKFDREVTLTGAFYLDLFQNPDTEALEQASLFAGFGATGSALVSTDADVDAILGTGFASTGTISFTGTEFSFAPTGENDGLSLDNFALAGFSYEAGMAPIPVPAAGFLLVGALGGLGLMRRRKG